MSRPLSDPLDLDRLEEIATALARRVEALERGLLTYPGSSFFYTVDGARTLNGPLWHSGRVVGFFGATPRTRATAVADASEAHATASFANVNTALDALGVAVNDLRDVFQRFGLMAPAVAVAATQPTPPTEYVVYPDVGLTGDGFLHNPPVQSCGGFDASGVNNYYQVDSPGRPYYKGIFVGVDPPCSQDTVYRSFVRFPIAALPGSVTSATVRFMLKEKADPTWEMWLYEIVDPGSLDFGDWGAPMIYGFGIIATPTTPLGWITQDVTAYYNTAKAEARSHMAFRLHYGSEVQSPGGISHWYGLVASDQGTERPELRVVV